MPEKENREDMSLRKYIQEAYGCSDEQLLKAMEEAEASPVLEDYDFEGAKKRVFNRIMEKAAERPSVGEEICVEEEKRVIRFPKKKVLLAVALVAVFAGALGFSAVGRKSYFFRDVVEYGNVVSFNNDKRNSNMSNIEDAYKEIEEAIDIGVLKLGYLPDGMEYYGLTMVTDGVVLNFVYDGNDIFFGQRLRGVEATLGIGSDRSNLRDFIYNEWIDKEIEYSKNVLQNGQKELEAGFALNDGLYYIFGIIDENEFIKIVENLNFY